MGKCRPTHQVRSWQSATSQHDPGGRAPAMNVAPAVSVTVAVPRCPREEAAAGPHPSPAAALPSS